MITHPNQEADLFMQSFQDIVYALIENSVLEELRLSAASVASRLRLLADA